MARQRIAECLAIRRRRVVGILRVTIQGPSRVAYTSETRETGGAAARFAACENSEGSSVRSSLAATACIRADSNSRQVFRAACILRPASSLKFHPCPCAQPPPRSPSLFLPLLLPFSFHLHTASCFTSARSLFHPATPTRLALACWSFRLYRSTLFLRLPPSGTFVCPCSTRIPSTPPSIDFRLVLSTQQAPSPSNTRVTVVDRTRSWWCVQWL